MSEGGNDIYSRVNGYSSRLESAEGYGEVWEIVKDTAKKSLGKHRIGMMLFLDDLPLRLGAYHPLGTNNIILNRALVHIVEATTKSRRLINAFVYVLLLHEYLHALGYVRESKVRPLVYQISRESFGEDHVASQLAKAGPWSLLKDIPLDAIDIPKQVIEIVKDFEKTGKGYIA
ncbi:MAG: hypothetical protein OEX09_05085 [Candidatus Bathyarchaeota archaeon]|nr:hypothetical protein [Candidatus Bathyarchaeota archaeon]